MIDKMQKSTLYKNKEGKWVPQEPQSARLTVNRFYFDEFSSNLWIEFG